MSDSNLRHATVTWTHDLVFEGGPPGGPSITVDGDAVEAISPVVLLLVAMATCTGSDIVAILGKMRVGLQRLDMTATGTRREEYPRRYVALHLVVRAAGTELDEAKARRAIDLSLEKYCSVVHSLAPDIPITYELVIE
jgi:putative redox protein